MADEEAQAAAHQVGDVITEDGSGSGQRDQDSDPASQARPGQTGAADQLVCSGRGGTRSCVPLHRPMRQAVLLHQGLLAGIGLFSTSSPLSICSRRIAASCMYLSTGPYGPIDVTPPDARKQGVRAGQLPQAPRVGRWLDMLGCPERQSPSGSWRRRPRRCGRRSPGPFDRGNRAIRQSGQGTWLPVEEVAGRSWLTRQWSRHAEGSWGLAAKTRSAWPA